MAAPHQRRSLRQSLPVLGRTRLSCDHRDAKRGRRRARPRRHAAAVVQAAHGPRRAERPRCGRRSPHPSRAPPPRSVHNRSVRKWSLVGLTLAAVTLIPLVGLVTYSAVELSRFELVRRGIDHGVVRGDEGALWIAAIALPRWRCWRSRGGARASGGAKPRPTEPPLTGASFDHG